MKTLIPLSLLLSALLAAPAHAVMPVEIRELHIKVVVTTTTVDAGPHVKAFDGRTLADG